MRFISPRIHGILDYAVAAALIAVPFVLDFAASSLIAAVLSVAAGVGLAVYSLLTDYSAGVRDLIPWRVHLTLDAVAAGVLLAAPFVFGFGGIPRAFYVTVAVAVLAVVATTQLETHASPEPARGTASPGAPA
jgi:hypothetical protein